MDGCPGSQQVRFSKAFRQGCTHIYTLHRTYLTPTHTNPNGTLHALNLKSIKKSFYHLIWSSPAIQTYWEQWIKFLHDEMSCLLNAMPQEPDKHHHIFMQKTL